MRGRFIVGFNPEREFPWQEDEEGDFLYLKTQQGYFELRPYDTFIFEPLNVAYQGLRHVYHATEELEDSYNGFYIWKKLFESYGYNFDVFVEELKDHNYHTETFTEPDPRDLRAYQKAHGEPFVPSYEDVWKLDLMEHDKIVERAVRNLDEHWYYIEPEWSEEYGN